MGDSTFEFTRSARSPRALAWVALWWLVVIVIYLVLNAAPLIVLVLAAFSLPALVDIGSNAKSELRITNAEIAWRSGRRGARLPRGHLKSVRLDTRLDLSLRLTLITHNRDKIRLPYECIPPAPQIEAALTAQNIPYERHHFTLLA